MSRDCLPPASRHLPLFTHDAFEDRFISGCAGAAPRWPSPLLAAALLPPLAPTPGTTDSAHGPTLAVEGDAHGHLRVLVHARHA